MPVNSSTASGTPTVATLMRDLRNSEEGRNAALQDYRSTNELFSENVYDTTVGTMGTAPGYIGALGKGADFAKSARTPIQVLNPDPLSDKNRGEITRPSTGSLWCDYIFRPLGFCK